MNHSPQSTCITTEVRAESRVLNLRQVVAWLPAIVGMLVICGESTRVMGADHTMVWLTRLCSPVMNLPHVELVTLNHVLRKCGHVFGYGTLGLILRQAWVSLLQTRVHETWSKLRQYAGVLAVLCVALVASLDELHQSFLPNRTGRFSDVLLDTSGALLLIALTSLAVTLRRKRILARLLDLRSNRGWQPGTWSSRDGILLGQSR